MLQHGSIRRPPRPAARGHGCGGIVIEANIDTGGVARKAFLLRQTADIGRHYFQSRPAAFKNYSPTAHGKPVGSPGGTKKGGAGRVNRRRPRGCAPGEKPPRVS